MARVIVRAALTSNAAVGFALCARVGQVLLAVSVLGTTRSETCDNADLLRLWLAVYAARAAVLARLLYSRHRLYARGAARRAGGLGPLRLTRARTEHCKARLDSLGTVWFVLGSLWLFGSQDCVVSAPGLVNLTWVYLVLGFLSLFAPILFFSALCCCLPLALSVLNRHGVAWGLIRPPPQPGAAAGQETDAGPDWIRELPCHTFTVLEEETRKGGEGEAEETLVSEETEGAPLLPVSGSGPSEAVSVDTDDSAPRSGTIGKRVLAAEDAVCVVCLGEYAHGCSVKQLPDCGHHFHAPCIDAWLRVNASCPLCKARVGPEPDAAAEQEEDDAASREAYLRAAVRGGDDLLAVLV